MVNSTFIVVPQDITDTVSLRRFLLRLVEQLDIAFGNIGNTPFTTVANTDQYIATINNTLTQISNNINILSALQNDYSTLDGSRNYTNIVSYDLDKTFTTDTEIISKKYADDLVIGLTANPEQVAITSLAQTISATYIQSEVQAISSKVDEILIALRNANIIAP